MSLKKRIALIGGAGFIGHNLALALARKGHSVHVLDSLAVNNFLYLASANNRVVNRKFYIRMTDERLALLEQAGVAFYAQDAREYHELSQLLGRIEPQIVVLLAAVSHADRSNKAPYSTFDHSFRTLENTLDNCRSDCVEHFIYFSSSMVYGHFKHGLVTEDTPCEPLGIYGALKYGGEKLVTAYNQVFGLPCTIVRPSALYGERCVSRRVVQIFVESAMRGEDIVIKGDGEDRLDFTYIDDLVAGVINVTESENSKNNIFNLTYGESRSLTDLANIVAEYFPRIKVTHLPKDRLTPERGTLSVEKARKMLGYNPQFPLEKGIPKYIDWYKSFL